MNIKQKLYNLFVECDSYIRDRYVQYKHQLLVDGPRALLQKGRYLAMCHFRRWILHEGMERDNLPYLKGAESSLFQGKDPEHLVHELAAYNVVSFDIFDTLLLRPFAAPVDLFHMVGAELGYLNYAVLRHDIEELCREQDIKTGGSGEVTLEQIYALMERQCGVPERSGMEIELRIENDLLYANPYMKKVFDILRQKGIRIIAVSDTYLPSSFIQSVLDKNGYHGIEKIFISCEYGCAKYHGGLFEKVKAYLGDSPHCVHIGDNARSDIIMARKRGFSSIYYHNVNLSGSRYRTIKQSRMVGSAYSGIVNAYLHNGSTRYTSFYEYGFIFGGLFVLGYCRFIHEYVQQNQIDRVLFLARDGDVLKQAYDLLYPGNDSRYVYWSREAAAKLGADYYRFEYLRRFLYNKIGRKQAIGEIIDVMELGSIRELLLYQSGLESESPLNEDNCAQLEKAILNNWLTVLRCYEGAHTAACLYFAEMLDGCHKACTVDVGWAGSGGVTLSHLVQKKWKLGCELTSLIAGTNTLHNYEPDATEAHLTSGKVSAYMFSMSHNRSYWEMHDPPGKGHHLYFEALLTSPTKGLSGFGLTESGKGYRLLFNEGGEQNVKNACETQAGVLDFVQEYAGHFEKHPYMMNISGSDAYAPFAAAMGRNGAYFHRLFRDCIFEEGVAEKGRTINEIIRK